MDRKPLRAGDWIEWHELALTSALLVRLQQLHIQGAFLCRRAGFDQEHGWQAD